MDIGNLGSKLESAFTKNVDLITIVGAAAARVSEETGSDLGAMANYLYTWFTNFNTQGVGQGGTNQGALGELIATLTSPNYLIFKLFQSNHLYTALVKIGIAGYVAGEVGLIPAKWKNVSKKVAWNAGLVSLILPGSGQRDPRNNPNSSIQRNFQNAPLVSALSYY